MKPAVIVAIVVVLFLAGLAGGYLFVSQSGDSQDVGPKDRDVETVDASPFGESAGQDAGQVEDDQGEEQTSMHGKAIEIPDNPTMCKIHHVPEVVDPFCDPSLIEYRGWCGGHDVAEALCTRCSPVLIAAFKAENDWCAEHGLPESQCLTCNPEVEEG